MQHAEVERIAGTVLIDPADVWRAAPDDQQFYDVTADKVIEAAKKLAAEKPHLAKPPTAPPPSNRPIEGLRSGARPEEPTPTPTWADAIRGTGR